VLLNIPTYFDVIEKPMDLSTVEKKLVASVYKTIPEFQQDMQLIFDNCYKFNGLEAAVSLMGKSLEKHFQKELEKLPKEVSSFRDS
jgi:bromodomain-containing factor 1